MNHLDFDGHLIRHRNDELLREVQELRPEERLRANCRPRSGWSHANNLAWRNVLSLLLGTGLLR